MTGDDARCFPLLAWLGLPVLSLAFGLAIGVSSGLIKGFAEEVERQELKRELRERGCRLAPSHEQPQDAQGRKLWNCPTGFTVLQ